MKVDHETISYNEKEKIKDLLFQITNARLSVEATIFQELEGRMCKHNGTTR
jgi:hypothetical protein